MTFLILLLAFAIERYFNLGEKLYRFRWFPGYATLIHNWFGKIDLWKGYQAIALILIPILLLVGIIYYGLGFWLFGSKFFLGLIIFIYCLGPEDLYHQTQAYLETEQADHRRALEIAKRIVKAPIPEQPLQTDRAVLTAILLQANDRIFAVIFWFVLLGPLGAVAYRIMVLLDRLAKNSGSPFFSLTKTTKELRGIFDWIPARLTALCYAVVGNFSSTFGYWLDSVFTGINHNRSLLAECGRMALKIEPATPIYPEQVRAGLVLVDRTLVAYLVAIGGVTLVTWLYIL